MGIRKSPGRGLVLGVVILISDWFRALLMVTMREEKRIFFYILSCCMSSGVVCYLSNGCWLLVAWCKGLEDGQN